MYIPWTKEKLDIKTCHTHYDYKVTAKSHRTSATFSREHAHICIHKHTHANVYTSFWILSDLYIDCISSNSFHSCLYHSSYYKLNFNFKLNSWITTQWIYLKKMYGVHLRHIAKIFISFRCLLNSLCCRYELNFADINFAGTCAILIHARHKHSYNEHVAGIKKFFRELDIFCLFHECSNEHSWIMVHHTMLIAIQLFDFISLCENFKIIS